MGRGPVSVHPLSLHSRVTDVLKMVQRLAVVVGMAMVVAACAGGTATSAPAGTQAAGSPSADAAASTGTPTAVAPGETTPATASPTTGGSGSGADACGLVTADEMGTAIGLTGLTQTLVPGPPDTCSYVRDGSPTAALVLTGENADLVYGAMAADAASTEVPGIGDKALYSDTTQTFLVQKGTQLLTIAIGVPDDRLPAARLDVMSAVATIAAGRM